MSEDNVKTEEGAALWRRFQQGRSPAMGQERPDALLLAAYLDGRLAEAEAARLEALVASDPALLGEILMLRESLAAGVETVPDGVVARAQALRAGRPAARQVVAGQAGWMERLFGDWLRPALPAFATLAVMLACAGAFELGRYQADRLDFQQSAGLAESDIPEDLLLEGLI